jgi:pyruvate/2-oxoglutarate dehydrogenase complex dihydrolipoamide dehydrogenase (E3) component
VIGGGYVGIELCQAMRRFGSRVTLLDRNSRLMSREDSEALGLELAGVELAENGYIKVTERLETTAPGVWAIGEVAGSPQLPVSARMISA